MLIEGWPFRINECTRIFQQLTSDTSTRECFIVSAFGLALRGDSEAVSDLCCFFSNRGVIQLLR